MIWTCFLLWGRLSWSLRWTLCRTLCDGHRFRRCCKKPTLHVANSWNMCRYYVLSERRVRPISLTSRRSVLWPAGSVVLRGGAPESYRIARSKQYSKQNFGAFIWVHSSYLSTCRRWDSAKGFLSDEGLANLCLCKCLQTLWPFNLANVSQRQAQQC